MHKHETVINGTKISFLTTKSTTIDVSFLNSIFINISPKKHNCKHFEIKEFKLKITSFPKLKAFTNELIGITIDKEIKSTQALYLKLKKALPSVFDRCFISLRNREMVLENDIADIYQSAIAILGEKEVEILGLRAKYNKYCRKEDSESGITSFDSNFSISSYDFD